METGHAPEKSAVSAKSRPLSWIVPGTCYMVKEQRLGSGAKLYLDALAASAGRGMVITRVSPQKLKGLISSDRTDTLWLTTNQDPDHRTVSPTNIARLHQNISEHLNGGGKVVLFEGVEYLTTQNDFDGVLSLLQSVGDRIAVSKAVLFLSIDPLSYTEKERRLIEKEFIPIEEASGEKHVL